MSPVGFFWHGTNPHGSRVFQSPELYAPLRLGISVFLVNFLCGGYTRTSCVSLKKKKFPNPRTATPSLSCSLTKLELTSPPRPCTCHTVRTGPRQHHVDLCGCGSCRPGVRSASLMPQWITLLRNSISLRLGKYQEPHDATQDCIGCVQLDTGCHGCRIPGS